MKRILSYIACALLATGSIIAIISLRELGWPVALFMLVPAFVLPVVLSAPGGIFALLFCISGMVLMFPLTSKETLPVIIISCFCVYLSFVNGLAVHWKKSSGFLKLKLNQSAIRDPRSDTYSSAYIRDILNRMMKSADRYNNSLTVCIISLDNLERIKNNYSTGTADMYLKICIEAIRKYIRNTDIIGRIGEDIFLVLFDRSPKNEIGITMDRVKTLLSSQEFHNEMIEISYGLCAYNSDRLWTAEDLIDEARKQMMEERALKPEALSE